MSRRDGVALLAVTLTALVLRLWDLGGVPSGFTADEAGMGYNAFSLLETGRDRTGQSWPLYVDNFSDRIEATYSYLAMPGVALFGLSEVSTRLPAALAGALTVPVLFVIGRGLFGTSAGLAAAALLAVSPWSLHMSRHAGSPPLMVLTLCLALAAFVRGRTSPRWLVASAGLFAISLYTYPAARGFVPLFGLALAALFVADLWRSHRREALAGVALFALLCLPGLPHWTGTAGRARADYLLDPVTAWPAQYLSYVAPGFLWASGDENVRHSMEGWGQMLPFALLTLPVGLYALWRRRGDAARIVAPWLLLFPLPAAFTDPGHAFRAGLGAPVLELLSGLGLVTLVGSVPPGWRRAATAGAAAVVVAAAGVHAHQYFTRYPDESALRWQHGMRETYTWLIDDGHARVYLSDRLPLPHIFTLFYTRFPPEIYQQAPLRGLSQGKWEYSGFTFGRYRVEPLSDILARPCDDAAVVVFADESEPFSFRDDYSLERVVKTPTGQWLIQVFACD